MGLEMEMLTYDQQEEDFSGGAGESKGINMDRRRISSTPGKSPRSE